MEIVGTKAAFLKMLEDFDLHKKLEISRSTVANYKRIMETGDTSNGDITLNKMEQMLEKYGAVVAQEKAWKFSSVPTIHPVVHLNAQSGNFLFFVCANNAYANILDNMMDDFSLTYKMNEEGDAYFTLRLASQISYQFTGKRSLIRGLNKAEIVSPAYKDEYGGLEHLTERSWDRQE
jgi:hypothetical protein